MAGAPLDVSSILARFDGVARIFPLPSLVLFPDIFVPLKIFEPRYVSMVQDALADDELIAIALLRPGWEEDYNGNPSIQPVVCLGKILKYKELPSGEYDILLYGIARAQIEEEIASEPYRKARVRVLEELAPLSEADRIAARMRRALELVPGRQSMIWELRRMANQLRGVDASAGRYADAVANAGDLQPEDRYKVLAETDVLKRFDELIVMLESKARDGAPTAPDVTDPRRN
ncbi:MAG: LON peptidase substrate-binding domain-containing protein [Planctomycetota bacterium]|nr:LON peptidase substrate-binding domain-containing protein [Planctomycetota bacterium]